MYWQLIILSVLINYIAAAEQRFGLGDDDSVRKSPSIHNMYQIWNMQSLSKHGTDNIKALKVNEERTNTTPHNVTYIDKAENMIRLPAMTKYYEEKNGKKRTLKKSPKRTIQKIIKKNRSKIRKLYIIKLTSYPTATPKVEFENAKEDFSARKEETTTQLNQKKRLRKYNSKLPRNPMPFHQMQTRKNNYYKREKRDTRDNIFILKDFDSMKFLHQKKDYNVLNAHFKKYW